MGHRDADQASSDNGPYTRVSLFLITGLCVGTPAVAWALRLLILRVRRGGRVSIFIIFLLLSDILELFLIPFVVASLLSGFRCEILRLRDTTQKCSSFLISAFIGTRLCGLCFHQLVALEASMSLRPPCSFACLSSPFFSIPICLTVWICTLTCVIHPTPFLIMGDTLFVLNVITAVFTCVLTIKAFLSHSDAEETRLTARGTGLRVLVVAMGTLWILYSPFIVWFWSKNLNPYASSMFVCIMGFRVVADPLLCALVWREESPKTDIELSSVQA